MSVDLSTNSIMVSWVRWARHVAWIKIGNTHKILIRKRNRKRPLAGLSSLSKARTFLIKQLLWNSSVPFTTVVGILSSSIIKRCIFSASVL
jgi:hypothetical protein